MNFVSFITYLPYTLLKCLQYKNIVHIYTNKNNPSHIRISIDFDYQSDYHGCVNRGIQKMGGVSVEPVQFIKTNEGILIINFDTLKLKHLTNKELANIKTIPEYYNELVASLSGPRFEKSLKQYCAYSNKAAIHILPSYNCNYHCTYCYEKSRKQCIESLSPSHIKNIVKFYNLYREAFHEDIEYSSITVSGGEPFLIENLETIKAILETWPSIPISFTTNGSHTKEYFPLLDKYSNISLTFSLDGTKEMHTKKRIPSSDKDYDSLIQSIKYAVTNNYNVQISTLFHPEYETEYSNFFDMLENLDLYNKPNLV